MNQAVASEPEAVVVAAPGETPSLPPVAPVSRPTRTLAALAWMVFACLLFAIMSLAAKRAMTEVPFLEVASGRALFGALTIWVWARLRGIPLDVENKRLQWARTSWGIAAMFFGFYALSKLSLGDAVTVANLSPLMLALVSGRMLDERAGGGLVVALLLGLLGVAVLAGAQLTHPHGGIVGFLGLASGVLGAFCSCLAMVYLRKLGGRESPEAISLHFAVWAAIVTFVVGLPWMRVPSLAAFTSMVVAGLCGGGAQVAMTKAYGLDKAARVGAFGYSGVVISQVLGVLFLHEIPGVRQLAGAALVILSGLFLVFGALREKR